MTRRGGGGNDDESGGGGGGSPAARRGRDRRASAIACAAACCAAAAAAAPLASSSSAVVVVSAQEGGAVFPSKSGKAAKSSKSSGAAVGPSKSGKLYYREYPPTPPPPPPPPSFVGDPPTGGGGGGGGGGDAGEGGRSSASASRSFPRSRSAGCVDIDRYRSIYDDVSAIASRTLDPAELSHFYGGIVRLAAHDFMDHDATDPADPMGSDGCIDWLSPASAGLNSIWHDGSDLYRLWAGRYADLSWADFWIIAANGVIFETSVGGKLDLIDTFLWGRDDRWSCHGSAERLPTSGGCRQVEGVFLERMGLTWRDAVALLGAHTLGRGHATFSGHHGTWVPNDYEARVFDRKYYQELVSRSWSPRVLSADPAQSDFTTGEVGDPRPKMMLNTDVCLVYDIETPDGAAAIPCCTRTDLFTTNGESHCQTMENEQCPAYDASNPRIEASGAVSDMLDGEDNTNFYEAFRAAWFKATTNGHSDLIPIQELC